jgi:hypothetical protein
MLPSMIGGYPLGSDTEPLRRKPRELAAEMAAEVVDHVDDQGCGRGLFMRRLDVMTV